MAIETLNCDLLVVGSGAGGLSTAITAKKKGLDVVVIEKAPVFGGTTAFSGGVLWIPGNHHGRKQNPADTRDAAVEYIRNETGDFFDAEAVGAFLKKGPEMVDFFEAETSVKFVPTLYPDYHPTLGGGVDIGRSILAAPFDIRALGKDMGRMRPPLKTITFIGMMFNSSNADLKHFFNATKSLTSFAYVCKRLAVHMKELLLYRRAVNVTSGNALASRLAKSALDLNIPIHTSAPAKELIQESGRVVGVRTVIEGREVLIHARKGVVLACGGFAHDVNRITQAYPHLKRGGEHHSPVPDSNTGDGLALVERIGVPVECEFTDTSAWMPTSLVPNKDGSFGKFPHLLDRYKPGVIGVNPQGQRFCNESESYHDVGAAMIRSSTGKETYMWLICDQTCLSKYGLGFVKPSPMPIGSFLRNGYLKRGKTLDELARVIGVDSTQLRATVDEYNAGAVVGEDRQFGRGTTSFNRYLADPENKPNPCVAPVAKGPYYAVKVYMGDLGTFDGIKTDVYGQVLDREGGRVEGLYAVGNDRRSIMGGNYPGAGITLGPIMTFGYITARRIAGIDDALEQTEEADNVRQAAG
ncbi:Succinate dehydrogenase/fumarate reductase, flavoprotein subunit [Marinobacterium lacunae]|uniref:Succinate dehydrogenase/fumarate reductase, flavoprotein subunit n=1 Tax=Marinobacterium lacunae TaxID=1232683 RepID=A0A081FVY5_9GAMM|nr:FAD-dependent oxidoreductase [Marinobacterium lacunae]KEA62690.1 Succinate dehydrogenase/fumarate reductase, flavoprotein subunit [Marinobacterium lacunae]